MDGKVVHRHSGVLLDTTSATKGAKWIFVMSTTKVLYAGQVGGIKLIGFPPCIRSWINSNALVALSFLLLTLNSITICSYVQKKKGIFHHSSFLAGGATIAAGRFTAEKGILKVAYTNTRTMNFKFYPACSALVEIRHIKTLLLFLGTLTICFIVLELG